MKFINTDGMAFIGPGSEWFWTALSGIVLAVTFIAIYRQLRIARSAEARGELASLDREWGSERQMRYRLEVFLALRDGADRAHLPEGAANGLIDWWESVGQLTRTEALDRKAIYDSFGSVCQAWWAILTPYVQRVRAERGERRLYQDTEWLAGLMAEMGRRAGTATEQTIGPLDVQITRTQDQIRVEQALRTVIVASPDAPPVAQPAAPAASAASAEG